jgi:8-oxo-dGTP pyrophosphatase MutT (NUDIX family)
MEEERSAGGVIFCGQQVLVLRNFRGEYIFPKGHLEPGETALQAALREVHEEAGVQPQVLSQLPDTAYRYRLADGNYRHKRVSWYLMEVQDPRLQIDAEEINWGEFMPAEQAAGLLTHDLDRDLLQQAVRLR